MAGLRRQKQSLAVMKQNIVYTARIFLEGRRIKKSVNVDTVVVTMQYTRTRKRLTQLVCTEDILEGKYHCEDFRNGNELKI